jgi:lysine biosynthesis protein LysW
MPKTYCLNCDEAINVATPRLGATVVCPECGAEMEVISVSPLELDFPLDEEWEDEEWEDEWEDEEEE